MARQDGQDDPEAEKIDEDDEPDDAERGVIRPP
jgi:hypothetical protein